MGSDLIVYNNCLVTEEDERKENQSMQLFTGIQKWLSFLPQGKTKKELRSLWAVPFLGRLLHSFSILYSVSIANFFL